MTLNMSSPPRPRKPRPTLHPVIEQLRLARYKQRITATMLAEMTGYSAKAIYQWEAGKVNPKLKHLADWAQALGMDLQLRATIEGE